MVCCLDVNVVFSKGPFSGFMLVFRGRNPSNKLHGFRGPNACFLRYFWKPSRSETQTTQMLLQFYRFPPLPPKASSNQGAEINDFCESHFCNGETWRHFLWCASLQTFLELPCDLHLWCFVLTSSDTAKLYDVEWTMSDPWPSDFTAGSFLASPQKQTITNAFTSKQI